MTQQKLNIIFAGTPDFSAQILKDLLTNNNINLLAVYTQPDRQSGRGKKITPSEVKQVILDYNKQHHDCNINIEQPLNFRKSNPDYEDNINKLKSYQPDLIIVVAYGLILPKAVIDVPKYGCINIHTSLLPRWRGAAPIQRAILAGDHETGVTIQQIDTGLDTGDIIAISKCQISNTDTTISLTNKLLDLSKPLLHTVISSFINHSVSFTQQQETDENNNNLVTYAHKLEKEESIIDFNKDAEYIDRQVRALNPWPGAKIKLADNNFIKVGKTAVKQRDDENTPGQIEKYIKLNFNNSNYNTGSILDSSPNGLIILCGNNTKLLITELQFSGGKMISVKDALNGKFKDLLTQGRNF